MGWEVTIAVKRQYYAVHLTNAKRKWQKMTASGRFLADASGQSSEAVSHFLNHDTSHLPRMGHFSRKKLRVLLVKLDDSETTQDTFNIILKLLKSCHTVEICVGNRGHLFVENCESDEPAVLFENGFLPFSSLRWKKLPKNPKACSISNSTTISVLAGYGLKNRKNTDHLNIQSLSTSLSLIKKLIEMKYSCQNLAESSKTAPPGPPHFPNLHSISHKAAPLKNVPPNEIAPDGDCALPWERRYYYLRCILTIAIFECLSGKMYWGPSFEAVDIFVQELLRSILTVQLFGRRSLMPFWKQFRSKPGVQGSGHGCREPLVKDKNDRRDSAMVCAMCSSGFLRDSGSYFNLKHCCTGYSTMTKQPFYRASPKNSKVYTIGVKPNPIRPFWKNYFLPERMKMATTINLDIALDAGDRRRWQKYRSVEAQCNILSPDPIFPHHHFSPTGIEKPHMGYSHESMTQEKNEQIGGSEEPAIGIIAGACRLPGGVEDPSDLWDLLKSGRSTASRIPGNRIPSRDILIEGKVYRVPVEGGNFITQDVSEFDPSFFNISVSEAENMDPQHRLLLECVQECIENAGVTDTSNVGVFVGLMEPEYSEMMKANSRSISSMLGSMYSFASGRINYVLGSHGPSVTIDTACSSSLVAVDVAINALQSGRCSTAIVAGVNLILSEKGQGLRANGKMLSRHGMSLSFDARASGYGRSDGCVALMLERMKPGRTYMARIVGTNVNHGGKSTSLTTPNPRSHQLLIDGLLRNCKCDDVQYWEAHGTGTRVGDLLEMKALSSTLQNLTVGSMKASVGHSEAAAGASALLKLTLMLRNNYIPPLVNFHVTSAETETGSLVLPVVGEERLLKGCGMSSFGLSGTNAAAIVTTPAEPPTDLKSLRKHYFLPVSAKSMKSLNMMLDEIKNFLLNSDEIMEDIAGAFAFHRNHYIHRCALIVDRRGRESQKFFGTSHKEAKTIALVLSNADVSYDMLQIPGFKRHFESLASETCLTDMDKLVISFIRLSADIFGSVDVFSKTKRELLLALVAFSFLSETQVSPGLLRQQSRTELLKKLARFDINPSNNPILERFIHSSHPYLQNPLMITIQCDEFSKMTHYHFLITSSHLYTNGFDLNFASLYGRPRGYVKIPTYSFNRRSLWFTDKPPVFDHYLLGMLKEETKTSAFFQNWLDDVRHPHFFKNGIIGMDAVVEIAHAALARQYGDKVYLTNIEVAPLRPVSPCLLETEVRILGEFHVVSTLLKKNILFNCIAAMVEENEMKAIDAKLHQLNHHVLPVAELLPLPIPPLKKSKVLVSRDLSYASVNMGRNESPYNAVIEASLKMNPTLVITSIQCISSLPFGFVILNVVGKDRALVVVKSQRKNHMLVYMGANRSRNSTGSLQKLMSSKTRSKDNVTATSQLSEEEMYKELRNEALISLKDYFCNVNELLSFAESRKISPDAHVQKRTSFGEAEEMLRSGTKLNKVKNNIFQKSLSPPNFTASKELNDDKQKMSASPTVSALPCGKRNQKLPTHHPDFKRTNDSSMTLPKTSSNRNGKERFVPFTNMGRSNVTEGAKTKQTPDEQRFSGITGDNWFNKPDEGTILGCKVDEVLELVLKAAQDVLSQQIPINEETLSMGFIDMGLDSLNMVEFVSRLNQKYFPEINVSTADIFDYPTIKQLAGHIRDIKGKEPVEEIDKQTHRNCRADEVAELVLNAVQDVLSQPVQINEETLSTGFIDMGLDSLNMVEFVSRLNQKYFPEINVSTADVFDYPTIKQLADYIRDMKAKEPIKKFNESTDPKCGLAEEPIKQFNELADLDCGSDKVLESVLRAAQDVLFQQIPVNEETLTMGFMDMGLDSLNMVEFVNRLNQKYFPKIHISTADIFDYPTIKQLAGHIRDMKAKETVKKTDKQIRQDCGADEVAESVLNAVQDVLSQPVPVNEVTLSMGFIDMGLDSLNMVEFVSRLNQKYFPEINISTADIFDYPTVEQLAAYIRDMKEKEPIEKFNEQADLNPHSDKVIESVLKAAQDVLSEEIPINGETLSMGFMDMGLDSLNMVEFVSRLKQKYFPDIDISTADIFDYPTINQLAEHIKEKCKLFTSRETICSTATDFPSNNHVAIKDKPTVVNKNTPAPSESEESSVYVEVFEDADNHPDILLTSWDVHTLSVVNLHDGSKLLFSFQSQHSPNFFQIIANGSTIKFHSEAAVQPRSLFSSLLFFARQVLSDGLDLRLTVSNSPTLANALARSFFKTLAAEKYPKIQYIYSERLVNLRLPHDQLRPKIGGNWLITGGLSGIGLTIAKWLLFECSAENLVLISRRVPDKDLMSQLDQLRKKGNVIVISADVANFKKLQSEFSRIPFNITGVIHSAGVLRDGSIERQTAEKFSEVFTPKGDGFHVIDTLLRENGHHLAHFIVMSSITVICGNAGQLNYGVSNAYLDHQMYKRRVEGRPGTTIHWGNWLDTGMARGVQKALTSFGFLGLTNEEALDALEYAIVHKPYELMVANVDWRTALRKRPDIRQDIVMKGTNGKPVRVEDFYKEFANPWEFNGLQGNPSPERECRKISSGRTDHHKGDRLSPSGNDGKAVSSFHPALPTRSKYDEANSMTCNIFGLNVFFDDMDDFCESVEKHLEALSSESFLSLPSTSSGPYALHVIGRSLAEIETKMKSLLFKQHPRNPRGKKVVMFAGQGSQYSLMGKQLSLMFPVFRSEFEKCLQLADTYRQGDVSFQNAVDEVDNALLLQSTSFTQPVIFAFGYACAMLWRSFGFQPDYYLGHSIGELVAGVVAGIMTLEEGVRIVVERGIALEKVADRGALLAIDSRAKDDITQKFQVSLAAINSSRQVVIAGTHKELLKVLDYVKHRNIRGKIVHPKYPFHSSLIQEKDLEGLRKILQTINFKEARIPVLSNVSGELLTTFSADYLIQQTISRVDMVKCIRTLEALGVNTWLEAGPANTMASFLRGTLDINVAKQHDILLTASTTGEDAQLVISAALALERQGVPISWHSVYQCDLADTRGRLRALDFPLELEKTISGEEREIVRGHHVNRRNIVPGAYQIYQLLTWNNSGLPKNEYFTMSDTKFVNPWNYDEGEEFKMTRSNANVLKVEVNGTVTCSSLAKFNKEPLIAHLDVDEIRRECTIECDVQQFYRMLAINGLDYSDHFRVIKSLRRSDTSTYSILQVKNPHNPWTLFDAAFHAVCFNVVHRRLDVYFVPIAIGEIWMSNSTDLSHEKTVTLVTKKVSENEKLVNAHACLFIDDKVIFQYKSCLSVITKSIPIGKTLQGNLHSENPPRNNSTTHIMESEVSQKDVSEDRNGAYIIGYDGSFCLNASDNLDIWQAMKTGILTKGYKLREGSEKGPALMDIDVTEWDPEFFGISPREAEFVDVLQRFTMKSVVRCMENAGWTSVPKCTGIFIGVSGSDFNNRVYKEVKGEISGYFGVGTSTSCIAGRIAHWLRTEGPAMVVDTACSSSFTALVCALDAISQKRCDHAIVGGVNIILHDTVTQVLKNAGMLSATGRCRVFDASADGYVRSEAVGCILLSREASDAMFRISHWATGHNGQASSLQVPNGSSQERLMRTMKLEGVDHVECHGTGTSLGDPIEIRAVSKCYGAATISSIKSLLGHAEAASGIVSLLACLQQMKHNYRVPQKFFSCPNPKADFGELVVSIIGEEICTNRMSINNFGFSGTNCSIVVEKLPTKASPEGLPVKYYIAPISSADKNSLGRMVHEFKSYVVQSDQLISHICTRLQKGMPSYRYRHCILYNYKRQIVWETGGFLNDSESLPPLHFPEYTAFAYGSGFLQYQKNDQKNSLQDFLKEIIPDLSPKSIPNIPMTSIRFHQFIANSFVDGHPINWTLYNTEAVHNGVILPSYKFNNRKYWPFKKQFVCNFPSSEAPCKQIYYKKTLVKVPKSQRDHSLLVVNIGKQVNLPNIEYYTVSELDKLNSTKRKKVVLYHPTSSSVNEALELISLWQALETLRNFVLVISCESNGTSLTEWTALCRTLASERPIPYKFVSYSSHEELDSELSHDDIFECVFYLDSCRHVERLAPVTLQRSHFKSPEHLLITGGTGGIGKHIMKFMNAKRTTIVTRNTKNVVLRNGEIPKTFIESDLITLSLPKREHYDVVVHCAGVVDNAPMGSMDCTRFDNVCRPKSVGFDNLLKNLEGRHPRLVVVASSVASILGSRGQANYAFANGLMTSIAEMSQIPTMVIHWGPWKNTGMLYGDHADKVFGQLRVSGWEGLEPQEALEVLNSKETNVMVFRGDFRLIAKQQKHLRKFLSEIVGVEKSDLSADSLNEHIGPRLEAGQRSCESVLQEIIASISGIEQMAEKRDIPLMNLGMDSLMIEELRLSVNKQFGCALKATEIYDNCTLDKLTELVTSRAKPCIERCPSTVEEQPPPPVSQSNDIAIIGYSGAFSGCKDDKEFWESLLAGKECITRKESPEEGIIDAAGSIEDIDKFDYNFWKMSRDDAATIDPQLRVFLQNAYQSLERSGYVRQRSDLKIGVFAGAEPSEYGDPNEEVQGSLRRLFKLNMKDFVSTFTAHMLNLRGPAIGVYSACSTALVAVTQACDALRLSKVDLAIAGAVSLVLPGQSHYEFEEGLVLSKTGVCRPFDSKADGTIRGSAVGCVVLKRLDRAIRDNDFVHAVIKSYGLSNDGLHKASFMAPNSSGQKECIREALASLNSSDTVRIRYVECHGTGTLVGDEIEIESMKSGYGMSKSLTIGSVKANIGHGFAAGGMGSLFKVMKILRDRIIPPQINLNNLQQDIPFQVNTKPMVLPPGSLAAVSSFGIGGTNVHIVLENAKPSHALPKTSNQAIHILPVSGFSPKACIAQCRAIAEYLRSRPDVDLEVVAATLQQRRDHFKYRAVFVVKSVSEAIARLEAFDSPTLSTPLANSNECFLFAPQGGQYPNMEKASIKYAEVFKKELERLIGLASRIFQEDFMEIMYPTLNPESDTILKAKYAQVVLFIISKAVIAQLDSWGISSDFLIGHSVGEYVAACYAGIVDEFSCMKLLKERGQLVSTTKEARMLAVDGFDGALPNDVEVTAYLSDSMKCVVGPPRSIEALKQDLVRRGIAFRELSTEHGFHSSMMDDIKNDFIKAVRKIPFRKGTKKIVSNVNGEVITEFDYSYCWNHMRKPVDLKKCLDTTLSNKEIQLIVEIGPSGMVKHLLAEKSADVRVISTVVSRRRAAEYPSHSQLFQCLADLWAAGYDVKFGKIFGSSKFDPNMPVYQFDPVTCWRDRNVKNSTSRYFKASWSLLTKVSKGLSHIHKKTALVISNVKQDIDTDCHDCVIHHTKPFEAFAFSTEELQTYSLIIYFPECDPADVSEPFLLSRRICQAISPLSESRFLAISQTGDATHWTALGPIKQYHLGAKRKNILVDNSENVPLASLIDNVLSMHENEEDVLFATSGYILKLTYAEEEPSEKCKKSKELGETVVVIGGSGAIGSAYVDVLRKSLQVQNVVVASRSCQVRSEPGVSYINMNVCDKASVTDALDEVQRRFGTINSIIHTAGIPTAPSLTKTTKGMLTVLQPKVNGVLNILEYLSRSNLFLDNLIMTSSLSSVVTLQGAEDYSAANIFLDALALKGHPNVKRMLTVQWPAWKDVGMASTFESEAMKSILSKAAISTLTGKRVIRETLGKDGVIAYSPFPPPQLAKTVEEIQLKGSTPPVPTIQECLSLTDKVISVWSEVLCADVTENSNFFDIGGNSLSALRVVWSLNKLLHTNISVDLLFKYPTLNKFVEMLPQKASKETPNMFDPTSPAELTYSQENMFILRQLEAGTHYNIIFSIHFRRTSPTFSFQKVIFSIHSLIARQHSLRTSFVKDSLPSKPKQVVHSLTECYQRISPEELMNDILVEQKNVDFNLEDIPLRIRGGHTDGGYVIVFNQHHILTDGWSVTVLAAELRDIYNSYISQEVARIKPLSYSVSQYASVQRRTIKFTEELDEFKALHKGREATTLPQRRSCSGPPLFKQLVQLVPNRLASRVKAIAKANQTTEFVVALSAFIISLRRFKTKSYDDSIVIGYPVSGRNDEVKDLIGYFLNNVVLAVDVQLGDGLRDVIPRVKAATTALRRFEKIPFHELAVALRRDQLKRDHLFEIFFNYRHQLDFPTVSFPDADVEIVQASMNKIFNFSITFDELPEGTRVMVEYNSSKYRTDLIQDLVRDMLRNFQKADPIIVQPRLSKIDYPHMAISQCLSSPQDISRIAIRRRGLNLSYGRLNWKICSIANWMNDSLVKSTGSCVRSDDVVTFDVNSNDAVVVILAIIRMGCAYAPMDRSWPELRKRQIIENVGSSLNISDLNISLIPQQSRRKRGLLLNRTAGGDLIYVIHTSGSLGAPKGVAVSHRNVNSFLFGATQEAFLRPGRVISHSVNVVFDVSVFNIFGSIVNGSELSMHEDIRRLSDEVSHHHCDVVFLTSAMFNALTTSELGQIQMVEKLFVGGDTVRDRNLEKVLKCGLDVTQIYGPTEGTVWALTQRCKALPEEGSLIGVPKYGEARVAQGVREGELILSGTKVARGYFNDPNSNNFFLKDGVPCYRTGDIVRDEKDGLIYLGRIDSQMKVRGHRIEGGEVEKAILEASRDISEAKVVVVQEMLVAFVVHDNPLDMATVLMKLESNLPSYMVPSRFIRVPEIPLNTSGKVSKETLLEKYSRIRDDLGTITTIQMSVTEEKVASIFEKLLNVKNVKATDNFFNLGGHSLLLFELKNQLLEEFDLNIEVHDLFANLTVHEIAKLIAKQSKEALDISIVTKLRETPEAKFNIYLIHAVGGSIFPYYAFLQVFPKSVNIYAIEFQLHFKADTIKQLAAFYAKAIAAHTGHIRPFVMGHSLGGTISKEIVTEMKLWGWEIPFVVMFDTWMVQQLDMERVTAFAKKTFLGLPDYEERLQKTTRLADMLRRYTSGISTTKIYLFKSAEVSEAEAFRRVVRPDLSQSTIRAITANGLGSSSTQPIDVFLIDGNHDSCMKPENLMTHKKTIISLFENWL